MLRDLFLRLDGSWPLFWTSLWVTFGLWLFSSLWPYDRTSRWRAWNHPALCFFLLLLAFVAFRWTVFGAPEEFNPDESQLLAGALTLAEKGGLWQLDMGTCGPWSIVFLTAPHWLGWPVDYAGGRCVALLMSWGSVVFVWLAFRHLFSDRLARLLVLPMACTLVFTKYGELLQYSSEHAPLFYFAAAYWLLVTAFDASGRVAHRWRLGSGGFLLGVLPFTKLQIVPLGLLLGVCTLLWTWRQPGTPSGRRWRDAAWLCGGVLLSAGIVLGALAAGGLLGHFYYAYLEMNVIYTGNRFYPWQDFGYWLWFMSGIAAGFAIYLWPSWIMTGIALPFWGSLAETLRRHLVLGGLFFLGGYFVVAAPGRTSQHYLQFIVLPTTVFLGVLYGGLLTHPRWPRWARAGWLVPLLVLGVGLQVQYFYADHSRPHFGELRDAATRVPGPVVQVLRTHARPGDTLSIWGWACRYYVQAQLPQATREAHTERQITPGPLREYYRTRYLADLRESFPPFFLDAVGPDGFAFKARENEGHETFPALGEFIATHYRLVADLESTRIYVRLDRLAP